MIVEKIESHLKAQAQKEVGIPRDVFRASGSGRCTREQAYQMLGVSGEPLHPRRQMTFMFGNLIEMQIQDLLRQTLGQTYVDGAELGDNYFEIDGIKISYHVDFAFMHSAGQIGVGEIKSMSDYAFDRAVKGQIEESYLCQAWCYEQGTSFNPIVFVCVRKETNHICEVIFDRNVKELVVTQRLGGNVLALAQDDPLLITEIRTPFDDSVEEKVRKHFHWLTQTSDLHNSGYSPDELEHDDMLPPGVRTVEAEVVSVQGEKKAGEYADVNSFEKVVQSGSWFKFTTGRRILGFPCSYCAFKQQCFPDAQLEINKGAPKWVIG